MRIGRACKRTKVTGQNASFAFRPANSICAHPPNHGAMNFFGTIYSPDLNIRSKENPE
jgi:hypothetical protein